MDEIPPSEQALVAATVRAVEPGVAAVDTLAQAARDVGSTATLSTDINLHQTIVSLPADKALTALPMLLAAATAGSSVIFTVDAGAAQLRAVMSAGGSVSIDMSGSAGDLAAERSTSDLEAAVELNDIGRALKLLTTEVVEVELIIRPPSEGAAWVPTADLLVARLTDGRWARTLTQLARRGNGRRTVVVVGDADSSTVRAGGLLITGPGGAVSVEPPPARNIAVDFRSVRSRGSRADLFEPSELVPARDGPLMVDVAEAMNGCARAACWYWLAADASLSDEGAEVEFDGVRVVEATVLPYGGNAAPEVELASWAMSTAEPARFDSIQQAITFAVRSAADLPGAAGPILRTARSLYELATRGAVSEALAARRASRDSAVTAARAAASTAREVASKAVERSLAVAVAASVALFANAKNFLDWGVTVAIVGTLAVLLTAALTVALRVDAASGSAVLDAFDVDVQQYRDTLSEEDVVATKNLRALTAARKDLRRARLTASWVYGTFLALVVAAGVLVVSGNKSKIDPSTSVPATIPALPATSTPLTPSPTMTTPSGPMSRPGSDGGSQSTGG